MYPHSHLYIFFVHRIFEILDTYFFFVVFFRFIWFFQKISSNIISILYIENLKYYWRKIWLNNSSINEFCFPCMRKRVIYVCIQLTNNEKYRWYFFLTKISRDIEDMTAVFLNSKITKTKHHYCSVWSHVFAQTQRFVPRIKKIGHNVDCMILLSFFWKCNYDKQERWTKKKYIINERTNKTNTLKRISIIVAIDFFFLRSCLHI